MRALVRYVFKLLGWEIKGTFPELDKYVVIAAPHTSNWDFILGLTIRYVCQLKANYIGKKALFKWPWGWFFRWTGGAPVDRSKNSDTVQSIITIFNEKKQFRLGLAPEGTRKKVAEWKSGFYFIALGAKVPIVMVSFDYATKRVSISEAFYPTGEKEKDFIEIKSFYKGVIGKISKNT